MPAAFRCRTGPQDRLIARRLVSIAQQAGVVSEPCLDVAGLVKARLEQLSDSRLAFRTLQRGEEGVPLARKSWCVTKNPSTALSKMTTLTCSSVSTAVMISLSSGRLCGPKIFKGGISKVTLQYVDECRARTTCVKRLRVLGRDVKASVRPLGTLPCRQTKRNAQRAPRRFGRRFRAAPPTAASSPTRFSRRDDSRRPPGTDQRGGSMTLRKLDAAETAAPACRTRPASVASDVNH